MMPIIRKYTYKYAQAFDGFTSGSVREAIAILREGENATLEELTKIRTIAFKSLISHAYENVPYYNELFNEEGIHPESIKSLKDIERIPVLTKDNIRKIGKKLRAKNLREYDYYDI